MTTNTQHTPGPWGALADGEANFCMLTQPNGRWLARVQFNGELSMITQAADQRLMRAAPDLLEAWGWRRK